MSASWIAFFVCCQFMFTSINATSLSDIESAHVACYRSTSMSGVMEGIYFPDSIAAERIIINHITCILRNLNAINSENSLNAEIVGSTISGIRQMELLRLNGGQPSEQRVRISDEVLFSLIPHCVTKRNNTAEKSVIKLLECLFRYTRRPIF